MAAYTCNYDIRFRHCDPAGLIFYPRAFEIVNDVIMDWFRLVSGISVYDLLYVEKKAFPTIKTECEFLSPIRVSDVLAVELTVAQLGNSSVDLCLTATCRGDVKLRARNTLVYVSLGGKGGKPESLPFTDEMRTKIEGYRPVS